MQTTFTIGDLAREFQVTPRTLRFYEDRNLIHPRRQGLSRIYSARDRARLKLILLGKRAGFPLDEIKEMLDLSDLKDARAPQLRLALARFGDKVETLRERRDAVEQAIGELSRTMSVIGDLLNAREAEAAGNGSEMLMDAAE